jgi:hypothetical protein
MQNRKSLSLQIAGAAAVAMLIGTSAFADSRHHGETARSSGGRISRGETRSSSGATVQRDRSFTRSERSTSTPSRSVERSTTVERREWRGDNNNSASRSNDTRRFESRDVTRSESSRSDWRGNNNNRNYDNRNDNRNNNRNYDNRNNNRNYNYRSDRFRNVDGWRPGSAAPYRYHESVRSYGRVERYVRERNGYRVWIGGGLYPIFIPFAHWRLHPLRVGLYINFGGYWDPLGYWSVYDYSPYDYRYDAGYSNYTRGEIRGIVESVDLRRGTMVINDDLSHQFVTVELPRDRRVEYARPGDYIELSGDWTRGGVFAAYRLDRLDEGRY